MNEKLTTEQREEFMTEAWANFEYAEIDGQTRNVITLTQLFEILTAHTAEDEDMCQCFTCQGSGKWASGFCPDSENPAHTAEDEPKPTYCTCGQTVCTCNPTVNWLQQEDK